MAVRDSESPFPKAYPQSVIANEVLSRITIFCMERKVVLHFNVMSGVMGPAPTNRIKLLLYETIY
jgi:hypothetical protein